MDKTENVLLVGKSEALGEFLVPKLETLGFNVIIADLEKTKDAEAITAFCKELKEQNIELSHIVSMASELFETGLTDIFSTTAEEIEQTLDGNLKFQLFAVRFFGELLCKSKAADKSITLMSSINAHAGWSIPFYSSTKAALNGFIRPVAIELGKSDVRINIVSHGSIIIPQTENQPKNFKARAEAAALNRLCSVAEVADGIVASINLTGMTGQEIIVDAGQSINPSESLYDQRRKEQ